MRSSAARPLRVSEKHFQQSVIELAEILGWRVAHFADSRRQVAPGRFVGDRQAAGFPDLTLVRGGRLIFAELKREGGRLSASQESWLQDLDAVGGEVTVAVWRPTDMASGLIERTLLRRA